MAKEKEEQSCTCCSCGSTIEIGEDMQYDKNYNTYCDNSHCANGIATTGTLLEECWFG